MIKGSSDFMEESSSLNVTTLPGLVAISVVEVEMFFIYHVATNDHVFKGYVTLWVEAFRSKSPPSKFGGHRPFCSRDIRYLIFHVT